MPDSFRVADKMRFWQFWRAALSHAFTKAWLGALAMSGFLAIAVPFARLLFKATAYQTFFDGLEHYWTGWILVAVFFVVLIGRMAYAPFLIYSQVEGQRLELKDSMSVRTGQKNILEGISARLDVVQKMVRVCNNPTHDPPLENVTNWETETRQFLREHVSKAAESYFTSEVGVPPEPACRWDEPRAGLLKRLHCSSNQLNKIFDKLTENRDAFG
jgi:hypothetical protein